MCKSSSLISPRTRAKKNLHTGIDPQFIISPKHMSPGPRYSFGNWASRSGFGSVVLLNVLGCQLTYYRQAETNAWFNIALRPRKPEGSLGRTAQDGHLDSQTAPELWEWTRRRATHSGTDRQEEVINKRLQRITACVRGCSLLTWPPRRGVCDVIHAPKLNLRMSFVEPSPMSSLAQAQQPSTSFKRDLLSLEVKENSNNDPRVLRQKISLSLSLPPPLSLSLPLPVSV